MLAKLEQAGFEIVNDAFGADAVIINTCGFIEDAKGSYRKYLGNGPA